MEKFFMNWDRAPADLDSQHFWAAIDEKKLLITRCSHCNEASYYPRSYCPHCGSDHVSLEQASGDGTIYSFSVMRKTEQPYVIAYVQLSEGPCVLTNIVGCDFSELKIGLAVRLEFAETNAPGVLLPVFRPSHPAAVNSNLAE